MQECYAHAELPRPVRNGLIKTLIKTAPLIHPVFTPGGVLKRIKYFMRGLAYARCTREWFEYLQKPEMAVIVKSHPYLFHKLQRPYLNCISTTRQRLEMLKQHYGFVLEELPKRTLMDIYATPGLCLATLELPEIGSFDLRLSCSRKEKEGDFSIGLVNLQSKAQIFTLSFSVIRYDATSREIFIGGLQGHKTADKDMVIAITRTLHGLRPKALLFHALQQLATIWHINRLRAVSDGMHIYRHFQKRREVSASYDEFWADCGGALAADKLFDLPVAFIPREISTIKPNKRQMYRRRYFMLAGISEQIQAHLSREFLTQIIMTVSEPVTVDA